MLLRLGFRVIALLFRPLNGEKLKKALLLLLSDMKMHSISTIKLAKCQENQMRRLGEVADTSSLNGNSRSKRMGTLSK